MQKEYQVKHLTENVHLLYGFAEECCIYVVEGSAAVAVIDNGMGTGDLRLAIEKLCPGKPVLAFNTHCHFDHSAGNCQFEQVRLHPAAYPDQDETDHQPLPKEVVYDNLPHYDYERIPVHEGETFDLGGKTLKVLETPGHTPGCICLLDVEDRLLFAGDLIGSDKHCIYMLASLPWVSFSTVSVETYCRSLKKLRAMAGEFDYILGGHDGELLGKEYLDELIRMSEEILSGKAEPYHPDMGPGVVCWRLDGKNTAILYQDEVIFDKNN